MGLNVCSPYRRDRTPMPDSHTPGDTDVALSRKPTSQRGAGQKKRARRGRKATKAKQWVSTNSPWAPDAVSVVKNVPACVCLRVSACACLYVWYWRERLRICTSECDLLGICAHAFSIRIGFFGPLGSCGPASEEVGHQRQQRHGSYLTVGEAGDGCTERWSARPKFWYLAVCRS